MLVRVVDMDSIQMTAQGVWLGVESYQDQSHPQVGHSFWLFALPLMLVI